MDKINQDLANIHRWALENGLCLNPLKSKCLLIHKRTLSPVIEHEILINNQQIEIVKSAKNLGLIFNNNLTWSNHVNSLVAQTYVKLRTLWSTQFFTPLKIRILLAKTYLIPGLTYGCELFAECDSTSNRKLNVLFNNITRYVYGLRKREHISSYTKRLYEVSLDNLLKIRVLIFLHKIIYTKQPPYLFEHLRFTTSPRGRNLVIPMHRTFIVLYKCSSSFD